MENTGVIGLKSERSKAILLLVITAVLWSLGGLLIKSVKWNPVAIAGMRSAIAAIVLLFALRRPKFNWSLPQIGAALSYSGTVILFVSANKLTTASNAILIQYTAPIYVAIFGAMFLKERTRLIDWATVIVVMGGLVLFFLDNLSINGMFGNIVAALSGVCFAFFAIFMRMQKDGSPLESVFMGNVFTAIIGLPFMLQGSPDKTSWINLILLGIVQLGIPYILYSKAIKQVTALEAILIPIIEPILNPVWVFLMLGEIPGNWAFAGGIVVLAAITFRCIYVTMKVKKD